jgi:hypothetical protein
MAAEGSTGTTQELEQLRIENDSQATTCNDSFEEIEGISQQHLIGEDISAIPKDKIAKWHDYVMTAVKRSRKEEIEEAFQKFLNNEGELYGTF